MSQLHRIFRATSTIPDPETVNDILLNSSKHLGLLDYEVWKKMMSIVKYSGYFYHVFVQTLL